MRIASTARSFSPTESGAAMRAVRRTLLWTAAGLGLAAAGYATMVGVAWLRYGHVTAGNRDEADPLLDRFMPEYEVAERHHVRVPASPGVAFAAGTDIDFERSALIRGIFKTRALVLGADPDAASRPRGLLAQTKSLGWGVLAEMPGREIVMGAVTQPWQANVVFRSLPPEAFASFQEPGYVKIAWTLRADPDGGGSVFRTETRVMTTDAAARRRFRWYWARFSPGIILIRRISLSLLQSDVERRAPR